MYAPTKNQECWILFVGDLDSPAGAPNAFGVGEA